MESCGMADLITTCYGGRNRLCAEEFAKRQLQHKATLTLNFESSCDLWTRIEKELLNGQKLQGTVALKELYMLLKTRKLQKTFPLFVSIYEVAFQGMHAARVIDGIIAQPIEPTISSKL